MEQITGEKMNIHASLGVNLGSVSFFCIWFGADVSNTVQELHDYFPVNSRLSL